MTLSYEDPQVDEYVSRKGWKIQKRERGKSGEHIVLEVCPLCGKEKKKKSDRNFYINADNGLWNTYCCDRSGNILTLKREFGDIDLKSADYRFGSGKAARLAEKLRQKRGKSWEGFSVPPVGTADYFHKQLMDQSALADRSGTAYEYLIRERALKEDTLRVFKLGCARRGFCDSCKKLQALHPGDECPSCGGKVSGADMIAIPYFVDGREVNFKFRSFSGEKRFEKWDGAPTTLFNVDAIHGEFQSVALCEGEIDAISLSQVGYPQSVATGGAGKNLEDDWLEQLASFDDVLLAQDSDEAGDKGADKCAVALGRYRCRRLKLPLKDVNDCLRSGMSADEVRSHIDEAAAYHVATVKPASDFLDQVRSQRAKGEAIRGRQTNWLGFNQMLGGWREGELTVVTGGTGSGKTTWSVAAAWDQGRPSAIDGPVGVLIASFEVRISDIVRKIICMESGKPFLGDQALSDAEFERAASAITHSDLFFVDQYGEMPLSDLRDAIEYGVRRYGLWFVLIDHLHFFLRAGQDERRTIDEAVRALKRWTLQLGIHMLLVVHPAKLRYDQNGKVLKVELNDLKGSSAIKQDTDNVIRVWRPRGADKDDNSPPYAEISALKVRSDFGSEDTVALMFDPPSLRYAYTGNMSTGNKNKKGAKKNGPADDPQASADPPEAQLALAVDPDQPRSMRDLHKAGKLKGVARGSPQ